MLFVVVLYFYACLLFGLICKLISCFSPYRCEKSFVTIQSSVSKTALKEKEQDKSGSKKAGAEHGKPKDIEKFHLYFEFTCNIQRIQPHQVTSSIQN